MGPFGGLKEGWGRREENLPFWGTNRKVWSNGVACGYFLTFLTSALMIEAVRSSQTSATPKYRFNINNESP
jgi:hypothetical protein